MTGRSELQESEEKIMKKELATRCELALMGMAQPISKEELNEVIPYIASAIGVKCDTDEVIDRMFQYTKATPRHFVMNTIMGEMMCLTVTLDDGESDYLLEDENGVFSSVYNFTFPDCSELGYTFFKVRNGASRRIA